MWLTLLGVGLLHLLNVHHGLEAQVNQRAFFSGRQIERAICAQAEFIHAGVANAEKRADGQTGCHGGDLLYSLHCAGVRALQF